MSDKPCVLLDRDGTIIVEKHYLHDPAEVELLPGAAAGLRRMRELGLRLVCVTNQSGVGRGYYSQEDVEAVNTRLQELLAAEGASLDAIFYCPHAPEEECCCRKPATGMADQAEKELGPGFSCRFMIGDKSCDLEFGRRLGARTILVRTGYGGKHEGESGIGADFVVDDLLEAAHVIESLPVCPRSA